jgi:uncharacterized protein (TIGR02117 family)
MVSVRQNSFNYGLLLTGVVALVVLWSSNTSGNTVIDSAPKISIYLVSHGWHAGIVLERQHLSKRVAVLQRDYSHVDYLEIGWGDSDFYQTQEPHFGLILKAGLFPSESVLHIAGFKGRVERYFPNSEIVEIKLSPKQMEQLTNYIVTSFANADGGESLGRGLYGDSRFYRSRESYHIFNTCNVWAARGLRQTGLVIDPASAISVDDLMQQAREIGNVIQKMKSVEEVDD